MIFPLLILSVFLTDATRTDDCRFVGLRMAKIVSSCENLICANLAFHEVKGKYVYYSPIAAGLRGVSCEEASQVRSEISRSEEPALKVRRKAVTRIPPIVSEITSSIHQVIQISFRNFLFMDKPLSESDIDVFAEVDQALLRMDNHGEFWQRYAPVIQSSDGFAQLKKFWRLLVEKIINTPTSYDVLRPETAKIVHFMYDLGSLFEDIEIVAEEALAMMGGGVVNPAVHRPIYATEYTFSLENIPNPVRIARVIDNAERATAEEFLPFVDFIHLLKTPENDSADSAILRNQIQRKICGNLYHYIKKTKQMLLGPFFIKTSVTMIHLCVGKAERRHLKAASRCLGLHVSRPKKQLSSVDFTDDSLPWIAGLNRTDIRYPGPFLSKALRTFIVEHRPVKRWLGKRAFSTWLDFEPPSKFEPTMRGLGRAIGLMVMNKVKLDHLRLLPESVFRAIRENQPVDVLFGDIPKFKFEKDDPAHMEAAVIRNVNEPVSHIRRGVQDVLGPLGLDTLTEEEWLAFLR